MVRSRSHVSPGSARTSASAIRAAAIAGTIVGLALLIAPPSYAVTNPNTVYTDAPQNVLNGPQTDVSDPGFADSPFTTSINEGVLKAYVAGGRASSPYHAETLLYLDPSSPNSLDQIIKSSPEVVTIAGSSTWSDYDFCGAWMHTASFHSSNYSSNHKYIGLYHAEGPATDGSGGHCSYVGTQPIQSIARAESSDDGSSFPSAHARIITYDAQMDSGGACGGSNCSNADLSVGNVHVIPYPLDGSTITDVYAYFIEARDSNHLDKYRKWVTVAHAPASGDGAVGDWHKYYSGFPDTYTYRGLGGQSNHLPVYDSSNNDEWGVSSNFQDFNLPWVSYNTTLAKYVAISQMNTGSRGAPKLFGLGAILSSDGRSWTAANYPFLLIDNCLTQGILFNYPSLIGSGSLEGNPLKNADQFWFYDGYSAPGGICDPSVLTGYFVRRNVSLSHDNLTGNPSDEINKINKIKLSTFKNKAGHDSWDTTGIPVGKDHPNIGFFQTSSSAPSGAYYLDTTQDLGYLLTAPVSESNTLYSCYIDIWGDHEVSLSGAWSGDATKCAEDLTHATSYIEILGYTVPASTSGAWEIWRCFTTSPQNHYIQLGTGLKGTGNPCNNGYSQPLGYVLTAGPSGMAVRHQLAISQPHTPRAVDFVLPTRSPRKVLRPGR